MMILHLIGDFFQLLGIVLSTIFLIRGIRLNRWVKKFVARVNKDNEIRDERLNLLSRENVKLRTENEILKDRLRNMGIKDFDVIN